MTGLAHRVQLAPGLWVIQNWLASRADLRVTLTEADPDNCGALVGLKVSGDRCATTFVTDPREDLYAPLQNTRSSEIVRVLVFRTAVIIIIVIIDVGSSIVSVSVIQNHGRRLPMASPTLVPRIGGQSYRNLISALVD